MSHQKDKDTDENSKDPTLEMARNDPASLYDSAYYETGYSVDNPESYGRREPWLSFSRNVARKVKKRFKPKTAVDVGCAYGLFVEALVDAGVDAYGYDISPFAVSNARDDMGQRINVGSVTEPIPLRNNQKYDIAICIEVLEHLPPEQADLAIKNLCAASDQVLFSSTPDNFEEPTHFNVLATEEWLKMFAENGFFPSAFAKANFIAEHAIAVRKMAGLRRVVNKITGL